MEYLRGNPGHDSVVIYLKDVNAMKRLPAAFHVKISDSWDGRTEEKIWGVQC